jgi:hypothetical protein
MSTILVTSIFIWVSPYRERRRSGYMGAARAIHNRSMIEEIIAEYQTIAGLINYS